MDQTTAPPADEVLLAAMCAGDRDAVAVLYDRHGGAVYGLAMQILRDPQLCEEVVQDTFLNVWRRAMSFDRAQARPATWLMTIAHNCAVDRLRREQVRPLSSSVELLDTDTGSLAADATQTRDATGRDPADVAEAHDRSALVRATLAKIPPRQREAIELAYFGGLSQSEVAERLGEPVGTIKTRTFHGMRRLRELLDAAGVHDDWA